MKCCALLVWGSLAFSTAGIAAESQPLPDVVRLEEGKRPDVGSLPLGTMDLRVGRFGRVSAVGFHN